MKGKLSALLFLGEVEGTLSRKTPGRLDAPCSLKFFQDFPACFLTFA